MNNFKDKKIVILGFGKEGLSTYEYIRKYEKEMINPNKIVFSHS